MEISVYKIIEASPPVEGLKTRYEFQNNQNGKMNLKISTEINDNQDKFVKTIKGVFQMGADGLKKLHEKEVN